MKKHLWWPIMLLVIAGALLASGAGSAAPAGDVSAQGSAFQTPTPGPDGRILYQVQEGDDLWTIAALSGLTVEELRALNQIQPEDFITPGMLLILGFSGPANPTTAPGAAASPTAIPDTPEPQTGVGEICVLLFIDANGDARIDEGEAALAQGQVSVADVSGDEVGERTTDDNLEGFCFTEIENGEYNVSAAVPPDFNPTTSMNVPVRVNPGDIKFVQFGAQPSAVLAEQTPESGGDRSTLLGLLGVVLLLAAGALGYYASRYGREARRTLR